MNKKLQTEEAKVFWGLDIKTTEQIHAYLNSAPIYVPIENNKLIFCLNKKEQIENFSLYLFDSLYKLTKHNPILGCHNSFIQKIESDCLSNEEAKEIISWQFAIQFILKNFEIENVYFEFENQDEHHMCIIFKNIYCQIFQKLFAQAWLNANEQEKINLNILL